MKTQLTTQNPIFERHRLSLKVLAYSEAVGATEGNIMAAIISVHTGTNRARPSPIVPVIPAIPRAIATVAAQAPAARISSSATSRLPGLAAAGQAQENYSPGPGERRGEAALSFPSPVDSERSQVRGVSLRDGQCRVRRVKHVGQLNRIVTVQCDEVLDTHVNDITHAHGGRGHPRGR